MHARYFSMHLGRFHSPDPVGGALGVPQSWNRYSYVLRNPMKYTDPRGLYWSSALIPFDDIPFFSFDAQTTVTSTPLSLGFFDSIVVSSFLRNLAWSSRRHIASGGLSGAPNGPYPGKAPDRSPRIFGFVCDDLLSPAYGIGAAGGAILGGAIDVSATPNRGELTITLGLGLAAGISVFPLGLSGGTSEGIGAGFDAVLGLPVSLNGILSGKLSRSPGSELFGDIFAGIGVGAGEGVAGGLKYTFELYDYCGQ